MVHWVFSLFYSDGMHLVLDSSLELGKSILKVIDSITDSRISNSYKNAVCSTDFKLNQEDFPTLHLVLYVFGTVIFIKPDLVNPFLNLLVLVLFIQINPLVIVMFLQVKLFELVLFV